MEKKKPIYKVVDKHRKSYPGTIKTILYRKNSFIKTPSDYMGVFAFKRKVDASNYIETLSKFAGVQIIKLIPQSPVVTIYGGLSLYEYITYMTRRLPSYIMKDRAFFQGKTVGSQYQYNYEDISYLVWPTPPGTVMCNKVFVSS